MLEQQLMAIEVEGAACTLVRWQRGTDIYREADGTEGAASQGYELTIDHARLAPEQALVYAQAIASMARRAIHLRSLDEERR